MPGIHSVSVSSIRTEPGGVDDWASFAHVYGEPVGLDERDGLA
ncbi:hypothetical protein [Subtercola vilae]|nr:hypothetical protein [Subtercola vilae]